MGRILTQARSLAQTGHLTKKDVGKLLSSALDDGTITRGERSDLSKVVNQMGSDLTPEAETALRSFLGLGVRFDGGLAASLFSAGQQTADALEAQGISSPSDLLAATRTSGERGKLALDARIDVITLTALAEEADLQRVTGVGKTYSAVLHNIGVNNVQELAKQNPTALRRQITSFLNTSAGAAIATRRPSLNAIKGMIESAKSLPKVIRYVDGEKSFSVEQFNALTDGQKAMLLFGTDVRISDVSIFEHEDLRSEVPRRKPRAITDAIEQLSRSGFDGEYDYAEMATIERIKLGDETIGYRMGFDVSLDEAPMDSEVGGGGGFSGWVDVAMDASGKVLRTDHDLWGVNHEM